MQAKRAHGLPGIGCARPAVPHCRTFVARFAGILGIALLLGAGVTLTAYAGDGYQVIFSEVPPNGVNPGLRLIVDARWLNSNGYRPIRLELKLLPPQTSPVERRFLVELTNTLPGAGPDDGFLRIIDELVLQEGATGVTKTLLFPQSNALPNLDLRVYEDGVLLEELSGAFIGTASSRNWTEASPAILFVSSQMPRLEDRDRASSVGQADAWTQFTLPDVYTTSSVIPGTLSFRPTAAAGPAPDAVQLNELRQNDRIEMISPADVPEQWIGLSCADLLFISRADLENLARDNRQRFSAIVTWAAAGHTLCVWDVDATDLTVLAQLDALLAGTHETPVEPVLAVETGTSGQDPASREYWRMPRVEDSGVGFAKCLVILGMGTPGTPMRSNQGGVEPAAAFRLRSYGLGHLVAITSSETLRDAMQMAWLLNSLEPQSFAWYQRFGMSLTRANGDYYNWLIPGVGDPPFTTFLVLLTGFVIVIGPVNYLTLRRCKRLYLLLITVPVAAALTTAVLLVYGFLSDGLSVRLRARSYTWLDPGSGQHLTWSRQSYYAGIRPSRGLVFDNNTLVYLLSPEATDTRYRRPLAELDWRNQQNWRCGYLHTRDTSQLMVVQAGPTPVKLTIDNDAEVLRVKNELGGHVALLLVVDDAGKWWIARDLAPGAVATLVPTLKLDATPLLQKFIWTLEYPASYYVRPTTWSIMDNLAQSPRTGTSVLESSLKRVVEGGLEHRTYVAVLDAAEWLPVGIPDVEHVQSLHVIEGRW